MSDFDSGVLPSSSTMPPMDVFGSVESVPTPKAHPVHHSREQPTADDSLPSSDFFTPLQSAQPLSSRAGSRRTQSVDVMPRVVPRQPAAPSLLGPARRKRGERDVGYERIREKDTLRAELDASAVTPGLALDPRIASDVLALERRFAAASKGKAPASGHPRPHRAHRPRHSLPVNRTELLSANRGDAFHPPRALHRAGSAEPLAYLPESSLPVIESDTSHTSEVASPSIPIATPAKTVPFEPAFHTESPHPAPPPSTATPMTHKSGPSPIRIDKSAYASLLPSSDPEAGAGSGAGEVKRTSKAAKRSSLTAMFGISRKKDKDREKEKEHESSHDTLASLHFLRPSPNRADTHNTTRTSHTMLTTHTNATAGTSHSGASSGGRSGAMSASPVDMADAIEPSAKTLARAAATRDQLEKRYAMLYAGLDAVTGSGESGGSSPSSTGSKARAVGRGINLLRVVRWRAANPGKSAHLAGGMDYCPDFDDKGGEIWERELERRARDAPLPGYGPGGDHPPVGYANSGYPAPLGDSLPEATSLSWLPYLEPVFAEERAGGEAGPTVAEGGGAGGIGGMSAPVAMAGTAGMGAGGVAASQSKAVPMTAWYVLASFVQAYVAAENAPPQPVSRPTIPGATVEGEEAHVRAPGENVSAKVTTELASSPEGRARSTRSDTHATTDPGLRFGIIDRALRTRSRQGSFIVDGGAVTGATRSRQNSAAMGTNSEPPSPSHTPQPGTKGVPSWLTRPTDVRARRSYSGSGSHAHSRSNSKARSISAGNGTSSANGNGYSGKLTGDAAKLTQPQSPGLPPGDGRWDGKSMSPASSRLNLANIIIGGAAVLGLGLGARRRPYREGAGLGVSGSENESGRLSSDMSPSDGDVRKRARRREERRGGLSDGEGGRVKRRKRTWREREEGSGGKVPLSDGGADPDFDTKRRSWRLSTTVMVPVEVQPEREKERADMDRAIEESIESDYARKQLVVEDAQDILDNADTRIQKFVQLARHLNTVHEGGLDIFGEMFLPMPPNVVAALASEDPELTPMHSPSTPTPYRLMEAASNSDPLGSFALRLEGEAETPATVDVIGRMKLNASLPIAAFEALHELEHGLNAISNDISSLLEMCNDVERQREKVKLLYELTAGSVETTYPECTHIEQLLGSLVTEDMPWLPSWLPLWVRHLLEIFSNQIQFMVENGLRIYGYVYHLVTLLIFLFECVLGIGFIFARAVRSYWWAFVVVGSSIVAYMMFFPPEGATSLVEVDSVL